ncbi:hypothetical protein [Rudanella lutea]|uniref:hypothetical protein n=1 Tax=Rudanella lutea TaxID=451374 RepID=UPI00037F19CE|nr:hypothetical protein [Rudanella lutea]
MKDNQNGGSLNGQLPPQSPNGSASVHKVKSNGQASKRPSEADTAKAERPKAARPVNADQRPSPDQGKTDRHNDTLTPAQQLSEKATTLIGKYPLQIIGGLLAVLAVIVLFKTFYQGKNWKAKRMAEEAYYVANQYARNNSANLQPYLSRAFRQQVRQLPGLLPLSMQTATRGGTVTAAESVSLREITPDSVIVELNVRFDNESGATVREERRYQPLVYEKDQWRLGLTYSR